jgi:ketosteroid isomerase-like protein
MRHSVLYLLAALALAGCSTMTLPPPTDFAVLEQQFMDAGTDKNYAQLEKMLAPDFTIIRVNYDPNEPIASKETWIKNLMNMSRPRYQVSDVRVKQHVHSALVHVLLKAEYPPNVITKEGGHLEFTVSDMWNWKDGRWQLTNRHSSLRQ